MGRIDAPTGEIASVGAGVAQAGAPLQAVGAMTRAAGGHVSDPPATAAALQALGSRWAVAATRLAGEIESLGRATQASAVAYDVTDRSSMMGGP